MQRVNERPRGSPADNFMSFSKWTLLESTLAAWVFLLFGSQQHSVDSGLANKSGVSLIYKVTVTLRKAAKQGFTNKTRSRNDLVLKKKKGTG